MERPKRLTYNLMHHQKSSNLLLDTTAYFLALERYVDFLESKEETQSKEELKHLVLYFAQSCMYHFDDELSPQDASGLAIKELSESKNEKIKRLYNYLSPSKETKD